MIILPYVAKDYSRLIGMSGFSESLLRNHFTLYQGYVTNTNKLLDSLSRMLKEGAAGAPEYAEIKRRLGWEFNGMRLHELYFENLGGTSAPGKGMRLMQRIADEFVGIENWEKDFRATGLLRGIGWAVLYQDTADGRLMNCWINEHDSGHPAGCNPLLVMDAFEHAFLTDYGLKRADYIDVFVKNINWTVVEQRFEMFARALPKAG